VRRSSRLQLALMLGTAVLLGGMTLWMHPRAPQLANPRSISWTEAIDLGSRPLWIDARRKDRYAESHHPQAFHLTEQEWDRGMGAFLANWTPERVIIVYCDSDACGVANHVARHLERDLGVPVRVLRGGWQEVQTHLVDHP
jgi:rhodanese-related sulfurtransferase